MATPADQRLLELLGRWLESLELHTKYSSLDDDSYWKVQPWSEHQRPNLWILNLAKQKTAGSARQVEAARQSGRCAVLGCLGADGISCQSGGLRTPRAIHSRGRSAERARLDPPKPRLDHAPTAPFSTPAASVTATREMPKFLAPNAHRRRPAPPRSRAPSASPRPPQNRAPQSAGANSPQESRPHKPNAGHLE